MRIISESPQSSHQIIWHCLLTSGRGFSEEKPTVLRINVSGGKGDWGFMSTCVWLNPITLLLLLWLHATCLKAVRPTRSCRLIWGLWEVCSPHRCFLLIGDNQGLFVCGHPSLVDEAGPKVVAGEWEMDSRAHAIAWDAAHICWTVAYLWGGNGRWSVIRSESEGLLSPPVKEGGSQVF